MNEPMKAVETAAAPLEGSAANTRAATAPPKKLITDPREIAAIVMAQLSLVKAKKDDLDKAVTTLTDMTQQLVGAYAQQARFIERLAQRAKGLETKSNGSSDTTQRAA
jgi:hypothetical protein